MLTEPRPLWKLLIETAVPENQTQLDCMDCFAILEYLAELGAKGADRNSLLRAAQQHISDCPDCQDYYRRRLNEMEKIYA